MIRVDTDIFETDQGYHALGIVARINKIGHYQDPSPLILTKTYIYKYLTFDAGPGRNSFAAEFVRQAGITVIDGQSYLDASGLKEGEIVVSPGFVYKKIPWSTKIMDCHLDALKKYRPKDIIKSYVDPTDKAIDLGTIDPHNLTKQ